MSGPTPPPSLRSEVRQSLRTHALEAEYEWPVTDARLDELVAAAADAVLGVLRTRIEALPWEFTSRDDYDRLMALLGGEEDEMTRADVMPGHPAYRGPDA